MTEKITVKTGFRKLSDSQAIAMTGTVIKGAFVDKAIPAAPPFDRSTGGCRGRQQHGGHVPDSRGLHCEPFSDVHRAFDARSAR